MHLIFRFTNRNNKLLFPSYVYSKDSFKVINAKAIKKAIWC